MNNHPKVQKAAMEAIEELKNMTSEEFHKALYEERDSNFFSYMDEVAAAIKNGEQLLDIHSPEFLRQT